MNIRGYICTCLALFFIFGFTQLFEYQILQFHAFFVLVRVGQSPDIKYYNMYDDSTFLRVFVGTVWDIYFLFYRNDNRPLLPSVKDGLKDDLLFFFEKQDYPFPDLSQMVKALSQIIKIPPRYWDCDEKEEFVERFSKQLAYSTLIDMDNMIKIKYTGTAETLKDCIIRISAEYACDGHVCSSAVMDIMNTIPDFDSLSLPEDVFSTRSLGDDEDTIILNFWKVVMNAE